MAITYLGAMATGRDNNFNLLRMLAASAVLVSHAWPIALGPGTPEPLEAWIGQSLGGIAVFLFFALSGFLITASFDRSRSARQFVAARVLRLVPCLLVSLLLVALVMGPLVTTLPVGAYLTHPETGTFLIRNLTLIWPQYTLPGVFETNPYPTVEGSIWTLAHEVACYVMVLVAGLLGILHRPRLRLAALCLYAAFWATKLGFGITLHGKVEQFLLLSFPFVIGMALYLWRDRIPLSLFGVAAAVALAAALHGTALFLPALVLALSYATFWAGYSPGGPLRAYNRVGDYSYGIYIYAFPVQGLVVWLWGPMTPGMNILLALPLTLALAALSWHFVEAPALELRHRIGGRRGAQAA